MNTFSLKDKVIVITGGTGGIGRGLVDYFIEQSANVVAIGSREHAIQELRDELAQHGKRAYVYAADLRNVPSIQPLFDKIVNDLGRIDILVNCAGMGHPIPALEVTQEDWDTMMNLNLRGAFFCAQAAAKHMLPRQYGRIINISSQISLVANQDEVVYCASKGGLNQMTRVLALEWGKQGVIVSAVAPTFTYTPGTAERLDTPSFRDAVLAKIPRGRLGTLEDVAAAVHYLASDSADMANGHVLVIDGGWTIV
ncbi:MAG: SDR family oxidoreductase [Candidatus Pelethousia sp.]|nr:SDR family oxidoreductase [Candidatus Pelethousia sp.]